ncbi:MAG: TonB-dependent receptor [Terriglobia bacterium]|jgi:hypothetical protein
MRRVLYVLVGFVLLAGSAVWAQDTATIVGTVTDASGAVIPGAKVTVSNPNRGFVREVASTTSGEYSAARIPIGDFVVTAEATGFEKLVRSGIAVEAGQTQRVDMVLKVGQVTEKVEVVGNVAKVETENATVSDVVTSKQIDNLALNGENVFGLEFLIPGAAITDSQGSAMELGHAGGEVTVSFNGNRSEYSQLEYDGGNNAQESSQANGGAVTPALDSIAEFRVSASNYGADVGQHAGALIEMVTKGGTKDFHGSAHEAVRNQAFDANDWSSNQQIAPPGGNAPKTPLQWNIFGYTLGGPFYIPKLYNEAKNKTFFFWSQEWARYRAAGQVIDASAPTQLERQGDFSECDPKSGNYLGSQYPQFNQTNCILPTVNGATVDKVTPVNNNGADWLNAYVPLPNSGPTGYVSAKKVPTNFSDTVIRVDQNLSDKASMFVRFSSDSWTKVVVPALWSGNQYDTTGSDYSVPARQTVFHLNYNIKPTLMNEFIMSYTDTPHNISPIAGPASIAKSVDKPSDWSASTFFPANANVKELPGISVGGGGPFGFYADNGNYRGPYDAEPVFTYRDNIVWLHGNHTIKAGVFLEKFQLTEQFGFEDQGYYNFANSGPLTTGNALADMFLGRISSYQEGTFNNHGDYTGGYGVGHWRRTDFEPYLQDDWKVNHRLTLNLGVRYYLLIAPHDVTKPTVDSSFIPSLYNPAFAAVLGADGILHQNPATGQIYDFAEFGNGLVECGSGPVAKGCQVPYKENIGPRFGFAWDPTGRGKTSIRGGYGIYYEPGNGNDSNTIGLEGNTPTTVAPERYNINGYDFGAGGFAGVSPGNPGSIPYYQKNPAVQQFNVDVQHEFKGNNFLTVAYVGNLGRHLDRGRNVDQIPIPVVPNMTVPALANVPDSNGNLICPGGVCNVQNILIHNELPVAYFVPYQGANSINQKEFTAVSSYNAMQLNFRHTTGYGLTVQAAYTWSHMMDDATSYGVLGGGTTVDANYDLSRFKGTSDLNRTQVLMLNYIYDLPFFKSSMNKFAKQALGGWRVSGITALFTGVPIGPMGTNYNGDVCGITGLSSGIGGGVTCDTVGKLKVQKSVYHDITYGNVVRWFDPSVLVQPTLDQFYANGQPGMFGYAGRNTLSGPGRNNFDLALFKAFDTPWFKGEHSSVQFRLETFNTFNHPQWKGVYFGCNGNPDPVSGALAFGRTCGGDAFNPGNGEVAGTWGPRNVQLGMKFTF